MKYDSLFFSKNVKADLALNTTTVLFEPLDGSVY